MKEALQEALFMKYASIFRQRRLPVTESPMGWGIECGDGWYSLLDGLCAVLTEHAHRSGRPAPEAVQVKQKFGTLRFYVRQSCDWSQGAVQCAEALSSHVCEESGRAGVLMVRNRWFRTLSEDVGDAQGYRPLETEVSASAAATQTVDGVSPGWRSLASVLKNLIVKEAASATLQLREDESGLSVEIHGGTPSSEGAAACARALSSLTDRNTGAMSVPGALHP